MRICALDLGTNTGFAVGNDGIIEEVGTWKLATAKEIRDAGKNRMNRRLDPRIPALWNHITQLGARSNFEWVVFEDVQFSSSTQQTQLWSSFRATVWLFAYLFHVKIECLATGKLKAFATGSGSADKFQMAHALVRQHSRFVLEKGFVKDSTTGISLTDDGVDATHLCFWSMKTLCRG